MARLVSMSVLSYESGNIRLMSSRKICWSWKQVIQSIDEFFFATHHFHHSGDIVWNKICILPRIGFRVWRCYRKRIEGRLPLASFFSTHELCFTIKHLTIVHCPSHIIFMVTQFVKILRHLGNTPVVIGVFQCFGHTLILTIDGYVPFLLIEFKPQVIGLSTCLHCVKSGFHIKIGQTFSVRIDNDRNWMITDHGSCFVAGQFPDREEVTLFILYKKCSDQFSSNIRI